MTGSPVAAANARTRWKRETPPIAAISSRLKASARWLSINQSAFWAGFMDNSLGSKHRHHDRFARAAFDSPCCRSLFAAILCRRRAVPGSRYVDLFLQILGGLLLRRLQLVHDLMQAADGRLQ